MGWISRHFAHILEHNHKVTPQARTNKHTSRKHCNKSHRAHCVCTLRDKKKLRLERLFSTEKKQILLFARRCYKTFCHRRTISFRPKRFFLNRLYFRQNRHSSLDVLSSFKQHLNNILTWIKNSLYKKLGALLLTVWTTNI